MNRRAWGILAGIAGSALGAWFIRSRRARGIYAAADRERGTVIFDNTPTASDIDAIV